MASASTIESATLIPRSVLFAPAARSSPLISPDGERLAFLAPVEGVAQVWVASGDLTDARPVTHDAVRPIRSFSWAADGTHLLYLQDQVGDERWHLYGVDLETGAHRDLTPFAGVSAQLLGVSSSNPGVCLVGLNRDDPARHDAYLLDLASGELSQVADGHDVRIFGFDSSLRVLAIVRSRSDGGCDLLTRPTSDAPWTTLASWDMNVLTHNGSMAVNGDGTRVYLTASITSDTQQLLEWDLTTGAQLRVLAQDDQHDVTGLSLTSERVPRTASVVRDRAELVALDERYVPDLEALRAAHPGDLTLLSADQADRVWTVSYTNDDAPPVYYRYDRTSRSAQFLFSSRPDLDGYPMAAQEPFTFVASDGLTVAGYLTFPATGGRTNLPTVLAVHGGPWSRDLWGFHDYVQLLANRGYLVMQVNYRGSTGYGKNFLRAGDNEWGAAMQTDLTDAVEHVVRLGHADRDRLAITGGSYGGYAALAAAAFTPGVFRCAVSVCGPSNLLTLLRSFPAYWGPMLGIWQARVGHPDTEEALLWERSPLSRADAITIPMLIMQGANDPRVTRAESDQIVAALEAKGIPHTYLVFEDEGHGFAKPENQLAHIAATEAFLAEHLGGRAEP